MFTKVHSPFVREFNGVSAIYAIDNNNEEIYLVRNGQKPAPDKPNFVDVGSEIAVGDTVCVIEAMKLFNEIESEVSGKIVKVLVDDSSPVEFDQPLFLVDPS